MLCKQNAYSLSKQISVETKLQTFYQQTKKRTYNNLKKASNQSINQLILLAPKKNPTMNRLLGTNQISQANYSSVNVSSKHKCDNCGLQFESPYELLNHTKKFCTNSGFDTLAGLNIKLKNPNYMVNRKSKRKFNDSLTNALEEIEKNKVFVPVERQMKNDLVDYQKHRENARYMRPYLHGGSSVANNNHNNNDLMGSSARKSRSLYIYQNQPNQRINQGQKRHDSSNIQTYEPEKSKAYSFTSTYLRKFKQSQAYVSPPSNLPHIQQQNAKHFSLLDRSDMSIRNMPEQQKREYVVRKILQLEGIEEGYKKNGGKNDQFVENTKKMKKFYEQLLEDVNNQRDERFGKLSNGTRVSTPISKLEELQQSTVSIETVLRKGKDGPNVNSRISQIHQKSMANKQNQIRKRFKTEFPDASNAQELQNDILDHQILQKINQKANQNQIIVIPIQQPTFQPQHHHQTKQTQLTLKYLQTVTALKDQQNRNFLQLLQRQNQQMKKIYQENLKNKQRQFSQNQGKIKQLENKYTKLVEKIEKDKDKEVNEKLRYERLLEEKRRFHEEDGVGEQRGGTNFRVSNKKHHQNGYNQCRTQPSIFNQDCDKQYRQLHPQLDNVRVLNIEQCGYHLPSDSTLSHQQRILLQMQHQQRDQLQLFSHLPPQIQQIKLESLKQTGEKRFQMEKQVIKQKLQKLKMGEDMKQFQLQRKLLTEELENEKKKIEIHKLMKRKVKHMVRNEFQQQKEDSQEDDGEEGLEEDFGDKYGNESRG